MFSVFVFFFFSSRRRHTRLQGDWSSDVCSSDLDLPVIPTSREEVLSGGGMRDAGSVTPPEQPRPASPIPHPGLSPITGPAARLVQNMTESLSVPTATSFRAVTVYVLYAWRTERN